MKPLDRILVPVDLGASTDSVVEAASQLATQLHARVRLLYVIEEVPHFAAGLELLKQAAEERLAKLHDGLVAGGVPSEPPMTVVGKPFDAIVRHADLANAHLIVMGRGGRSDAAHAMLGTTASRVMRRTSMPVFIVAPGQTKPIRRILCPVDGSNPSARGLRDAIVLARELNARLTVMTVIADLSPLFGAARRPDMAKVASDYQKMERDQFEQFIKGFDFRAATWDKEIHYGHPADEIVRLATEAKYDLVIMGSTGRSGLPRVLLGSTAETVARRAPCSVLTVKRHGVLSARLQSDIGDIKRLLAEGEELVEQGLYEDAISRFDQCLLKDPYSVAAVEGMAAAHERLGHGDTAADLQEQAKLIRRELWSEREPSEAVVE